MVQTPGFHTSWTSSMSPQDLERRQQQLITLIRWLQWTMVALTLILAAAGWIAQIDQLFFFGGLSFGLLIAATASHRIARFGNLNTSLSLLNAAIYILLALIPLFLSGLVPMILMIYAATLLLIGLFASPRSILQNAAIVTGVAIIPVALELWSPFSPLNLPLLNAPLLIVSLALVGGLIHLYANSISQSLAESEHDVEELKQSRDELIARTQELEHAAGNLTAQQGEIETANVQLEETVQTVQKQAAMLQASLEVSRAVSQIQNPEVLLPQVVQLISQHYDFYHAGIFLIDEASGYAVLRATNSPGGKRMLARQHKLLVGSTSIVGFVTGSGQPKIALDVGADAVFFDNPDLPDTRSEITVPLNYGGRVIGALDVQSSRPAAFNEDDLSILIALADQIAISIENAKMLQQTQTALADAEKIQRRFLRQEWDTFVGRQLPAHPSQPEGDDHAI